MNPIDSVATGTSHGAGHAEQTRRQPLFARWPVESLLIAGALVAL